MQVQGKSALNISKFIQCFNQKNSSHGIYYYESFTESTFDVKYVNTVKSTTYQGLLFKSNECLERNILKLIACKRPSSRKQMNRVQNMGIETCKEKYKR